MKDLELGIDYEVIEVHAHFLKKEDKKMYCRVFEVYCPIVDDYVELDNAFETAENFYDEIKKQGNLPMVTSLLEYDEHDDVFELQDVRDFLGNQSITEHDIDLMMFDAITLWH